LRAVILRAASLSVWLGPTVTTISFIPSRTIIKYHSLSSNLIYAHVDWPLERAAAEMTKKAVRHVIVLDDRSEVLGILSMRDIVRSWTTDGATCEVSAARAG
jgi:CBS domain-containing protein